MSENAQLARTLVQTERVGTLATVSIRRRGWPFASVMPYATHADGSPLFFISSMAVHTQNIGADPHASLLVVQSGAADPLSAPRATIMGNVRRIDPTDDLRRIYVERHPSAKQWMNFGDFAFFRMDVEEIYFVGGFGVQEWVR